MCGIAFIRLLQPLSYYKEKYGTWQWGLQRLSLLMEKQHNRGQDGAGAMSVKLDQPSGRRYIDRIRSNGANPISEVASAINAPIAAAFERHPELAADPAWAKDNLPFAAEVYLGHLRYGTYGGDDLQYCHPVMRENNWRSRNLALAGNFNLTNTDEIFAALVELGQHPSDYSDTVTILENVGHFVDDEVEHLFRQYKNEGLPNSQISERIEASLDIAKILERSSKRWDGGYVIGGVFGHGDAFVTRDPWGIRPAYYYHDDEVCVVASERPVIQTALNVRYCQVCELAPGHALIVRKDGRIDDRQVREPQQRRSCSFERIYFSRGSDREIYPERKELGRLLAPTLLERVNYDIDNTVWSYIPNTAETAFLGLQDGVRSYIKERQAAAIVALSTAGQVDAERVREVLRHEPRFEKIPIKDVKMRTFITADSGRDDMVGHVYDVTYGVVHNMKDTLVVIDDSIVRGTTLKRSILRILDRLHPKKVIIVSSAPQIRYPDCYGIDMAKLGDFCAFAAAIALLKETGREAVINEVYQRCKAAENLPKDKIVNCVKDIYAPFSAEQISRKIAEMLTPDDMAAEVEIVYQSIENLHLACPNDLGDWYFTGDYPTPGGNKVVNRAFVNYVEGRNERAY